MLSYIKVNPMKALPQKDGFHRELILRSYNSRTIEIYKGFDHISVTWRKSTTNSFISKQE